ncbi:MAG: RNA methyltransferase [Sedimentisphaerales bacterium]|nr:RNA methyltransferase [Sedimentisphaerales bacterium]
MITSLQNPFVKRLVRLHQARARREENRFLIEGEKELTFALQNNIKLESLIYCPDLLTQNASLNSPAALQQFLTTNQQPSAELIPVTASVYAKIAYRDSAYGLMGLAATPQANIAELKLPANPFLLVVDGIEKPGNLGALLRTADAAGVNALILSDPQLDIYNPNVIRASLGSVFTVPIFSLSADQTRAYLAENKINPVLTSPAAQTLYTALDYTQPTAIVLGSENLGLPDQWLTAHATAVKIPLQGRMDSLNLSASGAVILYEVRRQRDL